MVEMTSTTNQVIICRRKDMSGRYVISLLNIQPNHGLWMIMNVYGFLIETGQGIPWTIVTLL